jgi:hypothetical protein
MDKATHGIAANECAHGLHTLLPEVPFRLSRNQGTSLEVLDDRCSRHAIPVAPGLVSSNDIRSSIPVEEEPDPSAH